MKVRIEAFTTSYGNKIPKKYTCDGEELSPGLSWDEVPEGAKSFAFIMEDLDIPHRSNPLTLWIVYNIPGDVREIATNSIPEQAKLGTNDLGKIKYTGPCPEPSPDHHRYRLEVYALDTQLDLPDGATRHEVDTAMKDHILAKASAIGTYERHK